MDQSFDSPLISPSKARRDAAQANDWAYIASWLTRKYHPHSVPRFERNESTLQALLALAAFNDDADEEAELLHKAREEALAKLRARENLEDEVNGRLVAEMEGSLTKDGETALQDLAEASVSLGTLGTDTEDLGKAMVQLAQRKFEAEQQVRRVGELQGYLEKELARLRTQIEELHTEGVYAAPERLLQQTTEWNQGTKMLSVKLEEYRERIAALERYKVECPRIQDMKVQEREMVRLRERVKGLERRVQGFHGLPPDIDAAKDEYKAAEAEFSRLTRQRDSIFEGLVEGKSQ